MENNYSPIVSVDDLQPKSIPHTAKELRVLSQPSTWFRRNLVERTTKEFEQNPQLGLMLQFLLQEEVPIARLDYENGRITIQQYERRLDQIVKQVGNIFYK